MLDGFRFYMDDKTQFEEKVLKEQIFHLNGRYSMFTGEAHEYPKSTQWKGLDVHISKQSAFIKGSLHKFFNELYSNQDQNYNDFGMSRLRETIELMKLRFGETSISNATVTMLEMGFNIVMPNSPKEIVENELLMYNFKTHNLMDDFGGNGFEKEFWKGDYRWKVYDKGLQYKMSENKILRIEMKITAQRVLQRFNIITPSDLLVEANLKSLFEFFMKEFENLMIVDNLGGNLPTGERQNLLKITNPTYWLEFAKNGISRKITENRKSEAKTFIHLKGLDSTHNSLKRKLRQKFITLLNT